MKAAIVVSLATLALGRKVCFVHSLGQLRKHCRLVLAQISSQALSFKEGEALHAFASEPTLMADVTRCGVGGPP
jgi:hypothetical protein